MADKPLEIAKNRGAVEGRSTYQRDTLMIWKRKGRDEDAAVQAIRNRFATVLGLDGEEHGTSFRTSIPNSPDSESLSKSHKESPDPAFAKVATSENPVIGEEIKEKNIHLEEHLRCAEPVESAGNRTQPLMQGFDPSASPSSEVLLCMIEDEAKQFVQKTKALIAAQTKLFEHTLARMLNHAFSQAEASLHNAACRLEACYAQVADAEDFKKRSATDYSHVASETPLDQLHGFEGDLANIAKRFESGTRPDHVKFALGQGEEK